jgi:cell division protease FtsH
MTSGAADDLARATALAQRMAADLGMGEATTRLSIAADAAPGPAEERVERQARALLEESYGRARDLIEEHIDAVHAAATLLLEREAIGREEVLEIFGPRPQLARFVPRERQAGTEA